MNLERYERLLIEDIGAARAVSSLYGELASDLKDIVFWCQRREIRAYLTACPVCDYFKPDCAACPDPHKSQLSRLAGCLNRCLDEILEGATMAKRNKPQKTRTNPNNDIQLSAKLSRDVVAQEVRPAILLLEEIRDHQDKEKQRQLDLISCVSNVKNEVAALKSIIAGVDEILTSTRRHTTTNQVNTAKIRAAKAASETKPGLMPLIREYLEERSEDGWFRFGALVDFLVERYEPFGGYHKSLEELSNDARDRLSAPARGEHKGVFGMSPSHKLGIPMWRIDDGINNQGEPDYWYAFHDAFEDEDSWNAFADDTIFTD